jgi:hypothetical protein
MAVEWFITINASTFSLVPWCPILESGRRWRSDRALCPSMLRCLRAAMLQNGCLAQLWEVSAPLLGRERVPTATITTSCYILCYFVFANFIWVFLIREGNIFLTWDSSPSYFWGHSRIQWYNPEVSALAIAIPRSRALLLLSSLSEPLSEVTVNWAVGHVWHPLPTDHRLWQ